jgi:hypothetical protein
MRLGAFPLSRTLQSCIIVACEGWKLEGREVEAGTGTMVEYLNSDGPLAC